MCWKDAEGSRTAGAHAHCLIPHGCALVKAEVDGMDRFGPVVAVLSLTGVAALAAGSDKPMAKPSVAVNVSGTWAGNFSGGMDLLLHQDGSLVWGRDNGGYLIRGDWRDGRLTIFYRLDFKGGDKGPCGAPAVAVLASQGTATRLEGSEFLADGKTQKRVLTRSSPNPGAESPYPYGEELKACGSLPAHDLVFASNSDALQGTDWPLLAAVADLMKADAALKIQIAGHTDSTGDAQKNKELSQRRADSVKRVLVQKYGADGARVNTKGFGSEQPLAPNDTEDGRSINRRVEILVVS
jgi:outer membrane protein OmpA-like peptidoglycan-associated protein